MRLLAFQTFVLGFILAVTPIFATAKEAMVITKSTLRLFPEESSEVVAIVEPRTAVTVLQESESWVLIQVQLKPGNFSRGWVPTSAIGTETKIEEAKPRASSKAPVDHTDDYTSTSDPSFSFIFPTALQLRKGTKQARGLYFLGWELNYTVAEQTMLGGRILVPIGFLAGGLQAKQTLKIVDEFHVGLFGSAGGIVSLISNRKKKGGFYYLGGGMATFGGDNMAMTTGAYIVGGKASDAYGHLTLINVNAYFRVMQRLKLLIDAFTPIATHKHSNFADWTALSYGVRYGGTDMSGDIGFLIPIYDDAGSLLKYVPLGIPFVTFNVHF